MRILKLAVVLIAICYLLFYVKASVYEHQAGVAYARLQLGINRLELDKIMSFLKRIKTQKLEVYGNDSEEGSRDFLRSRHYKDLYPKDVFNKVKFDGSNEVLIYQLRRYYNFPNGWFTEYVFVFYDIRNDKVLGWGKDIQFGEFRYKF